MFKLIIGSWLEVDRAPAYLYLRVGRRDWCWGAE